MPIEVLDDVIEELANQIGIYGAHDDNEPSQCRICWTVEMRGRIESAAEIERRLEWK